MKKSYTKVLVSILMLIFILTMTGCDVEPGLDPDLPGDVAGSVIVFDKIENNDRLLDDISENIVPEKCSVLYDESGSRPEVTLTEPEDVMRIYQLLTEVKVSGKSNESVKASYHHIIFTLQDGTQVSFRFKGEELLNTGKANYRVSGGSELWSYVRTLQDEQMDID